MSRFDITKNHISQFLIFDKGDKNPHYFPHCMGYGFELHFAKPVLFENNGGTREDVNHIICNVCDSCKPSSSEQSGLIDLTFYEIWPQKDLLSVEILPSYGVKWPSESVAKQTRNACFQKVIELLNGKFAYPTEIKITRDKIVVPIVSIKSEAVLVQVSQNVKAKSLLSRIMQRKEM